MADFDIKRSEQQCPSGFTLQTEPTRVCVRSTGSNCRSIIFPTNNALYKTVCGRVIGYATGTPDSFRCSTCTIDEPYLDGVSITHGTPRQHIWSFGADYKQASRCPCGGYTGSLPSFVGDDYTCELVGSDPVWDGKGCSAEHEMCCKRPSVPEFCVELPDHTQDDIEVRLCTNEAVSNEDVKLESIELYVYGQ